ncbi:MAG: glycosyltransferase family 4 protein [Planctomycetes bacterium]|nr:glycosyltransferase family 4 protein [Planctomycetota bacterium]
MGNRPVRVAHIITRMILGGAQQSALYVCQALRRSPNWDATLITGPPLGPEGELLSEARRRSVPFKVVPELRRSINPRLDAAALLKLTRLLRRFRPTIVHTHSSKAGILGRFAAKIAHVPIIVHSIRGLPFHPYAPAYQNLIFKTAERVAAPLTDHYVCVSQAMVDGAVRAGLAAPDRFSVIASGIETGPYESAPRLRSEARRQYGFGPDDVVIGKIGRLFPLKGHRFLIQAAPRIVQLCPNVKLFFVGEGILREKLSRLAADLGVRERITFAGLLPPDQIPAAISAMDVLVHCSLREGLARVLVEALLCEKPVVSYALDGAPEVIIEGETGRLVPGESVRELADAVIWAVQHPERAKQMARNGRRRFAQKFSARNAAIETEALYLRLIREKGLIPPHIDGKR